jgi:hypothetical protein
MDWTIAAIAAPVVASLGTLWFSNSHADKADERKAAIERERWEFEARERRFQERLAAAAELDALADEAYLSAAEWYRARPGVKYASSAEHPPPLTTALEGHIPGCRCCARRPLSRRPRTCMAPSCQRTSG